MQQIEKKSAKPKSIRLCESTENALYKACQKEKRSIAFIVERALRKDLNLDS